MGYDWRSNSIMKPGILSQHANVGPTNRNTSGIQSGRLNNYSIWLHHDYTDASTITVSGSNGKPIQSIVGKGRRNAGNGITGTGGFQNTHPFTKLAEHITGSGQNGHDYASATSSSKDDMAFSNDSTNTANTQLSARAFTLVYIFDFDHANSGHSGNQWAEVDNTIFHLVGDGSAVGGFDAGKFRSMKLQVKNDSISIGGNTIIISCYQFQMFTNDGTFITLTNNVSDDITAKAAINDDNQGGDAGYNFNYIYVVGRSDGSAEMYIRGLKLDAVGAGTVPDESTLGGQSSRAWNGSSGGTDATHHKCYEYIVFNQELSEEELKDIDWYIVNKYNYEKGRAFGNILEGS